MVSLKGKEDTDLLSSGPGGLGGVDGWEGWTLPG